MAETRMSKNESRIRFSDEQIRFLEYMFKTESRPELMMTQQLADKTGLHPRQVAIWFQNKRARTKSRQMEREYNILKINYDKLASMSDSLRKENQSLLRQLQILRNLAEKHQESRTSWLSLTSKSSSEACDNSSVPFYEDNKASVSCFEEESKALYMTEEPHCSNELEENRCSFARDSLLDKWSYSSNWWEF